MNVLYELGVVVVAKSDVWNVWEKKRKRKVNARIKYWREFEPVDLVLITAYRDAALD